MTEIVNWGKWSYYVKKFKAKGFTLKIEVERKGYRKCDKGPRGSMEDVNEFTIYIDGKYNMKFSWISFDILDCILLSYLRGMELIKKSGKRRFRFKFKDIIKKLYKYLRERVD